MTKFASEEDIGFRVFKCPLPTGEHYPIIIEPSTPQSFICVRSKAELHKLFWTMVSLSHTSAFREMLQPTKSLESESKSDVKDSK